MVTNNEAVENFLNGKRSLAAYQFSQLIRDVALGSSNSSSQKLASSQSPTCSSPSPPTPPSPTSTSLLGGPTLSPTLNNNKLSNNSNSTAAAATTTTTTKATTTATSSLPSATQQPNSDEIAFNYALINLFTGCPQRASVIFRDLVKRYPRNPRLWLRLAESMLAAERAKMSEFEHVQQLANPHSRDHLIKTKNKPILIRINPQYCQQQIQQQFHLQRSTQPNFLVTIRGYLQKSLELIDEYNDISLLTDDIPNQPQSPQHHHQLQNHSPTHNNHQISPFMSSTQQAMSSSASITSAANSATNNLVTSSLTREPKLSQRLSYANPYRSISRSDLYHLRNKVHLNLAYVSLCMGEPVEALSHTTQCLKSSPLGYEKVLANLYHAEACILASRIDEAIQFLSLEVLNMAKSLSQEDPLVRGDKKRFVFGDDMQRQLDSGALATVVTYNLSVAYAAKGEFENAYKILMRSIQPTKPNPMQIIICLLYIQLQQGQLESAKRTILNNLPQFR